MKNLEVIMKHLGIPSSAYRVYGESKYIQINVEAGWGISIEALRQEYFNQYDIMVQINVSCVHTEEFGYCLMIEIFE